MKIEVEEVVDEDEKGATNLKEKVKKEINDMKTRKAA